MKNLRWNFPLARKSWALAQRLGSSWRERHQHPFNYAIHLFCIPLVFLGVVLLPFTPWYYGVGCAALGYLGQFLGHCVEGNDVGELIPLKRALGLPVVAIIPRNSLTAPAQGR